jgi:hypothetical protein
VLYIKGIAAMVVRKTISRLACSLKIQLLKNIAVLAYSMPRKNIDPCLLPVVKGLIKDSNTMIN